MIWHVCNRSNCRRLNNLRDCDTSNSGGLAASFGAVPKIPEHPIWVICSESHYSCFFSTQNKCLKGGLLCVSCGILVADALLLECSSACVRFPEQFGLPCYDAAQIPRNHSTCSFMMLWRATRRSVLHCQATSVGQHALLPWA